MRHFPHMQSLPFLPREPNTVPLRTSILGLKVLEQYVFMIIAIVYSQGEFWVNVPIPMFFPTKDWSLSGPAIDTREAPGSSAPDC